MLRFPTSPGAVWICRRERAGCGAQLRPREALPRARPGVRGPRRNQPQGADTAWQWCVMDRSMACPGGCGRWVIFPDSTSDLE
jgi:hypothetical protein